jgi:extracellular elastinolytic metalloproteinase
VDAQHPFVVVDLAGGKRTIHIARVSAMLRPAPPGPTDAVPLAQDDDPDSGARFTALRRFAIEACMQTRTNRCASPGATWKRVYTSPADAFPAVRPRPVSPNLALRTFDIRDTVATHVRLVALENQCTGYRGYAGEQDNDPTAATDCKAASDADLSVRAAELELF